ncbi:BufA2 family periplasmic bufferin-type metallophore [Shewanella sp. GXUN23E]|uniref:BufA2 family periplasmic bufferin-type metallophore n=1 Tax=Shewanella sp. GXUN23E TaxID=3422498 RepID=UPI003D7DC3A3
MMNKTKTLLSGAAMAVAMAGLAGCNATAETTSSPTVAGQADLVHCYGVNVCKGHNDCKTADNACGGHASCKGSGFVAMPSKSCKDVGGAIKDDWVGQIAQSDLVHCYGVNVCKGHNDCKTADNACAGHASCKGSGFVATPAKSCADMGGEVGA